MNRFGIRLAAGMAVICLGTIAVFQAQNAKKVDDQLQWPDADRVAAQEPPAPLGISSEEWPSPPDTHSAVVRANNDAFDGTWQNDQTVRLANHQDTSTDGPSMPELDVPSTPQADPYEYAINNELSSSTELQSPDQTNAGPRSYAGSESFASPGYGEVEVPADDPGTPDEYDSGNELQMPSFDMPQTVATSNQPEEPTSLQNPETGSPGIASSALTLRPVGSGVATEEPTDETLDIPNEIPVTRESTGISPLEIPTGPEEAVDNAAATWGNPTLAQTNPSGTGQGQNLGGSPAPATSNPYAQPSPAVPRIASSSTGNAGLQAIPSGYGASVPSGYGDASTNGVLPTQIVELEETLAQPGVRELEGQQTPNVIIEKRAPAEVRVGKPTEFVMTVRNVGRIPALDVRVFDRVPEGTELVETVPPSNPFGGMLTWQLGDLEPGQERSLIVRVVPQTEGEIGSVARVTFEAAASVRTVATQPALKLVQNAPPQVLIGQQLLIDLELSNSGSGAAQNVVLKTDLPDGLEHEHGKQIELPIGQMPPGDARRQVLRVRATKPGLVSNTIWLVDADGTQTPSTIEVEVVAPAVDLALEGPSLRYLERQATYQLQIGNSGTADATNVEIAAFLDKGLKFVSTESAGQYDPNRHAVFWSLEELPAGQAGSVALTLLPVEAGSQDVRLEARADLGVTAASQKELTIETLAELTFSIADDQDPIEVGADTTYTIRVQNLGSRDDTNVQLQVQLPHPAMQVQGSQPDAQQDNSGRIVFEPIARIPAKGEQLYVLKVRGMIADTHLIKATIVSDQSRKPVTKEESTTVYSDK